MFNIESYITPILLSYVDKYVRDFKPADAQVSLWAGGVTLHNLVLKADVLQQEVALPFTLVSGRIHELLIQVPWTKIMSEPIVVTINTIECVLSLNPPPDESPPTEQHRTQVVEAPPGYMQALVRRIVSNIVVRINSLIVKYVHDDIVLSLNVKKLSVDSVGVNWKPLFADIDPNFPAIRRLVHLDDLTLCLDKSDSDGKIRFYQEPLLYRCQLDLRVLTKLVSATKRRATSLNIQLQSNKLAWGVTNEQLVLLLRLLRERTPAEAKSTQLPPKQSAAQATPSHGSTNMSELTHSESWSDWAWSWLPAWDREDMETEIAAPPTPVPITFTAYFENISLVFKVMENEGSGRKRARGILELTASDAVVKTFTCYPSTFRIKFGTRYLTLASHGRCVCGHISLNACNNEPTIYLSKLETVEDHSWSWEEEDVTDQIIETAIAADELEDIPEDDIPDSPEPEDTNQQGDEPKKDNVDAFWTKMMPVVYLEYIHERTPSDMFANPFENPPRDYQYSDWMESNRLKVSIKPMLIQVTTGLLHRLHVISSALREVPPPPEIDLPMRVLTVEECDALSDNLPQKRISVNVTGVSMRVYPWDHSAIERGTKSPLALDVELPKGSLLITGPLYPYRVCSAACQMPGDTGPLWHGARMHVTASVTSLQIGIASTTDDSIRPCARMDFRVVTHSLLHRKFFKREETVVFSYTWKFREINICGSRARLLAAIEVPTSLWKESISNLLKHSTLATDVLSDEESVAVDLTAEEFSLRGFLTKNTNTHIITMHSVRATAFHARNGGDLQQAWIFSAPEAPTTTPYLRAACQWCNEPVLGSLEYLGIWLEPTALSVDPLLIAWLAYAPKIKAVQESVYIMPHAKSTSSQYLMRKKSTPPSSSGRGGSRSGSGAELVHIRPHSVESSSERSERRDNTLSPPAVNVTKTDWWNGDNLLKLHSRLNRLLITVETGLVTGYVTETTASAVDCITLRDAMERHALTLQKVLVFSFGRLSMYSSSQMKYLWHEIRHDGPTFLEIPPGQNIVMDESFPWKLRLADMSCYTLEMVTGSDVSGREKSASGLRSQLKLSKIVVLPKTVLEMFTTTVTLSVVTKSLVIKTETRKVKPKKSDVDMEDERTKFFTSGTDFKPSSLKEFIRGPTRRKRQSPEPEQPELPEESKVEPTAACGPVVSLGINLHADTPPLIVRLDQDQVQVVAVALHCLAHLITLLQRAPLKEPKQSYVTSNPSKTVTRSSSEMERQSQSEETITENPSEQLISIFESNVIKEPPKMKSFFWLQWVVSRVTVLVATQQVKLAFEIDDIISSLDLQEHYNQLKLKIASASIKHYTRNEMDEWIPGVLGGRVLEVREPADAKEENHFLGVTITQAQIANLPESWREELHPKLLDQNGVDSMWEVYATLAPLEVVLQPTVLEHIISCLHELAPSSNCPLKQVKQRHAPRTPWDWPYCYITAGGLRVLMTCDEYRDSNTDDSFMFIIGKVTVNPYPENPICRRPVNSANESTWMSPIHILEGRQYEILVKNIAIRSAIFSQVVNHETFESEMSKTTSGENPALKWSQRVATPVITPVLHPVDVGCVLAPPVYVYDSAVLAFAVELNIISDCAVELSIDKLNLAHRIITRTLHALRQRVDESAAYMENDNVCPYATLLAAQHSDSSSSDGEPVLVEDLRSASKIDLSRSFGVDSGVETVTSNSTFRTVEPKPVTLKKSVSIAPIDHTTSPSDYLEVLVTMGMIELSLYVADNGSEKMKNLLPPKCVTTAKLVSEPVIKVIIDEKKKAKKSEMAEGSADKSRSLTETVRNVDIGKTKLELPYIPTLARKTEGNIPLVHLTLHQPNLYFVKRKLHRSLQVTLFNVWVGLGAGEGDGNWNLPLVTTAKGTPDPVTDIPPALAMLRIEMSPRPFVGAGATNTRGVVKLDIERPILLEVSSDRLMRLNIIRSLMKENLSYEVVTSDDAPKLPAMYKLRKTLVTNSIESITIVTSQIGVRGSEGAVGWDSANLQLAIGSRPDRVVGRGLLTAVLVSTGPPGDRRHIVLQPLMIGGQLQASWDSWRRAEGCPATTTPDVSLGIDFDRITIDLRPEDLAVIERIKESTNKIFGSTQDVSRTDALTDKENSATKPFPLPSVNKSLIITNNNGNASNEHYYKDDLRSGAFKIVSGQQLPLAYQVTLYGSTVSWKYPHPRTITYITAYPIPGNDKEIECVLELYCPLLSRWETHTYFTLPLYDPNEIYLKKSPNDTVFALTWRVRACSDKKENVHPFEFDSKKFMPRKDPLSPEPVIPSDYYKNTCEVSAEQLSGVLRVDSYFAPRLLASVHVAVRLASLDINVYNDIPKLTREALTLEGYYVSRPLMKSHRVLTVGMRDTSVHSLLSPMSRVVFETNVTCDILDTSMGTMEQFIEEFRIQGTLSLTNEPRVRFRAGDVRVLLDVPRVCTTRSLANDWTRAYKQYIKSVPVDTACKPQHVPDDTMASVLDGRIGLWVHNKCSAGLRIGQEGTEEVMPLGSGVSLAYRWRSPAEPKNIRFALATPTTNWHWSTSVPFTGGTYRVTLEDLLGVGPTGAGLVLYVRVVGSGPRWDMYLTGRLKIANMTRFNLLYKVRTNSTSESTWPVISSGELSAECIGRSVLCSTRCEAVFKVKLACQESGWSGDIPLKECRKENVPWLVKVPTGGEVAYMSVWCRVTRARSDGRIIASIWPFYVLRSHLPLDTEVTIKTLCGLSSPDSEPKEPPAPIVQTAEGRGTCTHLAAPGTTAAHHMLTFQYKNLGCPVTREAIPLHYGVTDTSVFDKPAPTVSIEDIAHNLKEWIKKSGQRTRSQWPYSLVSKHWPDPWQPAILQPRSDITIRYSAVRIGGGCSLELHLCPVVLLANASPIALTLRAHDAAPLCKLEPGVAASLPSSMLQKAFFMSVEMGRETFVSGQLQVSAVEPGRYGSPPPGHIALDRASNFAIHCHQKVALLTMYYEIKENINVFGITSTFVLINRLQTELMVAAIAVPNQIEKTSVLRPKVFNVIQPTEKNSMHGTALGRFWVRGRWRGGDADELRTYLCLALPEGSYVASQSVPVRLGVAPVRRAIALLDQNKRSVPLVVSQLYHEGRWVITVADDPCPQFLVQNRTGSALAIAQPVGTNDEPSVTKVQAVPECEDALWWCSVGASSVTHYSTPAHCARYPPLNTQLAPIPFLTVGSLDDLSDPKWCQPVAVTDGEQLLQLSGGVTIKVRIRTYPHSTYIELLDVDQNDISASDIRRRLVGPFSMPQGSIQPRALGEQQDFMSSTKAVGTTQPEPETETIILTDKSEDSKSTTEAVSSIQPETSAATKLLTNKLKHSKSLIKAVEPTQPEPEAEAIMLTDKLKVDSKSSIASKDQILNDNQGTTTIRFDETRTEIADVDESHLMKLSGVVPEGVSDWSQIQGVVSDSERLRCVVGSVVVTFAASSDVPPLLSLHLDRAALVLKYDDKKMESELSILDVQIDNAQYETGQYDFGVVATTRAEPLAGERWAALWGDAQDAYSTRASEARLLINTCHDKWTVATYSYKELTEVEVRVGPLALYIEDSYISAALDLFRLAVPTTMMSSAELALAEFISLQYPLRLRKLYLHPLDLTLTLHTAVRMYIALDQSPLRLSAFQLQDVMTSTERLTHALTVHYLSAAILGAGWVVGGLELLGAPGALAARVGGASGGVRGVASAAAAALLKSLSACAGSLARNLDILAGDEEHARRAAAARRRPPPSLVAGLVAGITNFAINILGAVGGLAHHPLVGMAVGETESSTAALRRGLVGAITKPLSATADLVAYAGQGLLTQTGWDPVPQPRYTVSSLHDQNIGWRRDCVRWSFRLAELITIAGFEALVNDVSLQLLITHKFLVVVDPDTERIMEMIEFKSCSLTPYTGQVIELHVNQKHLAKISETQIAITDEDNDYQINVAAMARVARYTGAEGSAASETSTRVLTLLPGPGKSHALYALLSAALHHNNNTHFPLL